MLGLQAELSIRDPDERVEPIEGAHGARQDLHRPVAPLHVFELVDQRAAQCGRRPFVRVGWQHDHWTHDTARDWRSDVFVYDHVDGLTDARRIRECGQERSGTEAG